MRVTSACQVGFSLRSLDVIAMFIALSLVWLWPDSVHAQYHGGSASFSSRFDMITATYRRERDAAIVTSASRDQMVSIGERRRAAFVELLGAASTSSTDRMSPSDLVALATAAEHIRDRVNALKYSQIAQERAPEDERVYFPLVRTLLNLRRLEEARALLASGLARLPFDSDVHFLHNILFAESFRQGRIDVAAYHIQELYEFLSRVIMSSSTARQVALMRLEAYTETCRLAGVSEHANASLLRYHAEVKWLLECSCNEALAAMSARERGVARSALWRFACEIKRYLRVWEFADETAAWLFDISRETSTVSDRNEQFARIVEVVRYIYEYSYCLENIKELGLVLDELLSERVDAQTAEVSKLASEARRAVLALRQHLDDLDRVRSLHGAYASPLGDVVWQSDNAIGAELYEKATVLCFWRPSDPNAEQILRELLDLRKQLPSGVALLCVVPDRYSPVTPPGAEVGPNSGEPSFVDQPNLIRLIGSPMFGFPCAIVRANSATLASYAVQACPETVVVDRSGVIRSVVLGWSESKASHIRDLATTLTLDVDEAAKGASAVEDK